MTKHSPINAPQPGLRSFIIYDSAPAGCIVHEVEDSGCAPHVREGDFVVVDPSDRQPDHGDLFLIQWDGGKRQVIESNLKRGRYGVGANGAMVDTALWWAHVRRQLVSLSGKVTPPTCWADGPYREAHFREKLVGRVIGILEPDFRVTLTARA